MNKTNTYSFLLTTMLTGVSQTALGNLNGWDSFVNYSYNEQPESNSSISMTDVINVEVVKQFAENLAGNMTGVDPDIQQIVDEHFWEML